MSMSIQFNLCTYNNYSVRLPVCTSSHGRYIVARFRVLYHTIQVSNKVFDTHPCLVTIYRLLPDTGREVSAPTVSTHNRHQLSHQLSVVIASTLYLVPDTIVSLYTESPNRIGGDTVLLDLRTTRSSTWSSIMSLSRVSKTSVTASR